MNIEVRIARTIAELSTVFRLRHQVYVEEHGYLSARSQSLVYDRFDFLSHTAILIVVVHGTIVGTARMIDDEPEGSPADEFYDFPAALPGERRASGSMLCVHRDFRHSEVVPALMNRVNEWALDQGIRYVYSPVNPEKRRFFERHGYIALDRQGVHPVTRLPFLPMALTLSEAAARRVA